MAKQPRPRAKDPVALAKAALADVLARAIGSKDDERILAASTQVLSVLDKPVAPRDAIDDPLHVDVSKLSDEQFAELCGLLDAFDAFAAKVNGLTTTPVDVPVTTTVAPPISVSEPVVEDEFVLGENEIEIELDENEVLP